MLQQQANETKRKCKWPGTWLVFTFTLIHWLSKQGTFCLFSVSLRFRPCRDWENYRQVSGLLIGSWSAGVGGGVCGGLGRRLSPCSRAKMDDVVSLIRKRPSAKWINASQSFSGFLFSYIFFSIICWYAWSAPRIVRSKYFNFSKVLSQLYWWLMTCLNGRLDRPSGLITVAWLRCAPLIKSATYGSLRTLSVPNIRPPSHHLTPVHPHCLPSYSEFSLK